MSKAAHNEQKAFLRLVAERAAKNTGDSVARTLQRAKSQAYLLGRLLKKFPSAEKAQLRDLVEAFRKDALSDPQAQMVFERPRRPPARGREPESSPKWDERVAVVAAHIDVPLTSLELRDKLVRESGWKPSFAMAVVAAAESRQTIEYWHPHWMPVPPPEKRIVQKNERVKITKTTREIMVRLTPAEVEAMRERQLWVNARRGNLIAMIADQEKEIRRRHKLELQQVCAPLKAERNRLAIEAQSIMDTLTAGETLKEVPCEERIDYSEGQLNVVRMDTKDVIARRALVAHERQLDVEDMCQI